MYIKQWIVNFSATTNLCSNTHLKPIESSPSKEVHQMIWFFLRSTCFLRPKYWHSTLMSPCLVICLSFNTTLDSLLRRWELLMVTTCTNLLHWYWYLTKHILLFFLECSTFLLPSFLWVYACCQGCRCDLVQAACTCGRRGSTMCHITLVCQNTCALIYVVSTCHSQTDMVGSNRTVVFLFYSEIFWEDAFWKLCSPLYSMVQWFSQSALEQCCWPDIAQLLAW